jgi:hypothetical protein
VLDSTDPAHVKVLERKVDLAKTLFIVSSKSGSTLEPNIFKAYFVDRVTQVLGAGRAASHFIAITDPGSDLEKQAKQDGFRHIFPGVKSIGGRYSALSNFGMVPAAVMGLDVERLLIEADRMLHACAPGVPAEENPGLALGAILGVLANHGIDKLTFVAPEVTVTPVGMFPRMKRFTVVGTFHVGAGEIDGYIGLTSLTDLAHLHRWQPDQVQGLRLKFSDLFDAPRGAWEIAQHLGETEYYARDWTRTHGNLYQAIRMEKAMIGLLLLLIIAVAAFNIISTLVMVVNDKKGDIAILRTLGATPGQIMAIFMVQGTVIGVLGTLIGTAAGMLVALNVSAAIALLEKVIGHKFLNADVYFIDYLPSQVQTQDVLMVGGTALVLSFLATLYPAWSTARTQPAQALRYE